MSKDNYEDALIAIKAEIEDCSRDALDDNGECICCMYPCWKMVAREAIEKQLEISKED